MPISVKMACALIAYIPTKNQLYPMTKFSQFIIIMTISSNALAHVLNATAEVRASCG